MAQPTFKRTGTKRHAAITALETSGSVQMVWSAPQTGEYWRLAMQGSVEVVWPAGVELTFGGMPKDNQPGHVVTFVKGW